MSFNRGHTCGSPPHTPPSNVYPSQVNNANNASNQSSQGDGGNSHHAATNLSYDQPSRGPGGFTPTSGGNAYGTSPYRDGRNHPQPEARALHEAASSSSMQATTSGGNGYGPTASQNTDNDERTRQAHVAARNSFARSFAYRYSPSSQAPQLDLHIVETDGELIATDTTLSRLTKDGVLQKTRVVLPRNGYHGSSFQSQVGVGQVSEDQAMSTPGIAQVSASTSHVPTTNLIQPQAPSGAARAASNDDASPSQVATEFTRFSELPLEIRVKIWKACVVPRLLVWGPGGAKGMAHFALQLAKIGEPSS